MRFDLQIDGGTQGSLKKFAEVVLSFVNSANVKYGIDINNLYDVDLPGQQEYGTPPELYTGDIVQAHDGGFDTQDYLIITGDSPLPCTLRAMIPRVATLGR